MLPSQQTNEDQLLLDTNGGKFLPAPRAQATQRMTWDRSDIKLWLMLLIILGLGSLGSLLLVPSIPTMSPVSSQNGQAGNALVSTPVPTALTGGECTATPDKISYFSEGKEQAPSPPEAWADTGYGPDDFANAQACAASFVIAYETLDAENSDTFEASVPLLSQGASDRFYGRVKGAQPDQRTNQLWQGILQKQQRQQSAQAGIPNLLSMRAVDERLLVWMAVPYKISMSLYGEQINLERVYTVLLVSVPPQVKHNGTGWQVSFWQNDGGLFEPPVPL